MLWYIRSRREGDYPDVMLPGLIFSAYSCLCYNPARYEQLREQLLLTDPNIPIACYIQ